MRALIHLLLYGHFWIALAALGLYQQSQAILFGTLKWSAGSLFVGAGTLALYALHRLVGMQRIPMAGRGGRYEIIGRYATHIRAYALGAGALAAVALWRLPVAVLGWLTVPVVLSLAYVLPVFGGQRLRDLPYIKIFVIALTWSWLTVLLPALEAGSVHSIPLWIMWVERMLFVFAITIPFDIRDLKIDQQMAVRTLPAALGEERAGYLAYFALLGSAGLVGLNAYLQAYAPMVAMALLFSLGVAALLIAYSHPQQPDHYYTGWLDGTMILQAALVCGAHYLSGA